MLVLHFIGRPCGTAKQSPNNDKKHTCRVTVCAQIPSIVIEDDNEAMKNDTNMVI